MMLNDPPALKGHDKKEGTGEAWDLGRYSGRGHGGRGSGWLFEQQVEYDSEHKVTSGRAIMAATPPFRSSIRFSVDGASGTSVSGFRCTEATYKLPASGPRFTGPDAGSRLWGPWASIAASGRPGFGYKLLVLPPDAELVRVMSTSLPCRPYPIRDATDFSGSRS